MTQIMDFKCGVPKFYKTKKYMYETSKEGLSSYLTEHFILSEFVMTNAGAIFPCVGKTLY